MSDQRCSDSDEFRRDIPSFIEPRPPLVSNPFMRPRPQKGTNLMELFEEDSECEEPELVQVYLRLKPGTVKNNLYEVRNDKSLITSVDSATVGHGRRTQHNVYKQYMFSHIFRPDSSQKEVFDHVVKDNLRKLLDGHNFTLLTYGASGSGKTYTLMGTIASPGLVPRSLEYVFKIVDAAQLPLYKPAETVAEKLKTCEIEHELQWVKRLRQFSAPHREKYRRMSAQLRSNMTTSTNDLSNKTQYYVWVSFVEIYNEGIYDLLSSGSDRNKASSKLRIREDANGNAYVKGVTQAFVRTGEEAYDVMVAGKHNLQVAATGVHARSSRSHCIFTITMLTETETCVKQSFVRLCDLAGSERARATGNEGARMQESRSINSSLMVLERCLHTLRRKQQRSVPTLVPYRESKLTRLLGAGLSGSRDEAISMVVTLNTAPQYAHETRHVLQLAAVARDIHVNQTLAEGSLERNQDATLDCGAEVTRLRAENERLHFELVQAQTRNKELVAAMEAKQQEVAQTMFEYVEEAKDMTRQYYEKQLQALRAEMDEMQEEYETKLNALPSSDLNSPTQSQQTKISQLMTDVEILKESLDSERLELARAEKEIKYLRGCIERRGKTESNSSEEQGIDIADSETDEECSCDESLEPTFKKEDINRSRLLLKRVSFSPNTSQNIDKSTEDHDQSFHKLDDTMKDEQNNTINLFDDVHRNSHDSVNDSNYVSERSDTGSHNDSKTLDSPKTIHNFMTKDSKNPSENCDDSESKKQDKLIFLKNEVILYEGQENDASSPVAKSFRGTYFVKDSKESGTQNLKDVGYAKAVLRGTYFVEDPQICNELFDVSDDKNGANADGKITEYRTKNSIVNVKKDFELNFAIPETVKPLTDTAKSELDKFIRRDTNSSLAQFEQLEKASESKSSLLTKLDIVKPFTSEKMVKENSFFFDNDNMNNPEADLEKTKKHYFFNNIDVNIKSTQYLTASAINILPNNKLPSVVKEEVNNHCTFDKELHGESFRQQDFVISAQKLLPKKHVSVDIFEGFDSPVTVSKAKEHVEKTEPLSIKTHNSPDNVHENTDIQSALKLVDIKRDETDVFIKPVDPCSPKTNRFIENISSTVKKITMQSKTSILDTCIEKSVTGEKIPNRDIDNGESTCQSIENLVLSHKKKVEIKMERSSSAEEYHQNVSNTIGAHSEISKENNTIEEFENIYKDVTAPRATEFDLIVQEMSKDTETETERKYNLRHKNHSEKKEHIEESTNKTTTKRNLRLRRRKNETENKLEDIQDQKLKDIVNLQKEFSDVTMDVPAPKKDVKDIVSPKRKGEDENQPPVNGIQSCPSKSLASVTRSRRKLFTPRAEPLEESLTQTGDSDERICVPRPSYHRGRARRKL